MTGGVCVRPRPAPGMLCPSCRRQVERGVPYCARCGDSLGGGDVPLELVLGDGRRVALVETVTLGRGPENDVALADPSVSRAHACIVVDGRGARLEDAGSSHGTWLDGRWLTRPARLRDGARVRLGDVELVVEARRPDDAAGRTVVVRGAGGAERARPVSGVRPRARGDWALKRLEAAEGERRFVLRDLRGGEFARMDAGDAALFELLDGSRDLAELVAEAERLVGADGRPRLARLLADLGERGLLEGVDGRSATAGEGGRWARLVRPRTRTVPGAGAAFERLYERGGFVLFTRPALFMLAAMAVAGLAAFVYLVAGRYGTPLVVASKIGIGGLVFLAGRFALVFAHEIAHGLAVTSYGRRVDRAGLKLLLVLPYAFVDTSEAWFEPRRRRIAISAAGPASDLALGGALALASAAAPAGTVRDILFQLALAGYVGAAFNLNPMLDRDGYHILADALREPGLRRRSREQLARRLAGGEGGSATLARYAVASAGWTVLMAAFVIVLTLGYRDRFEALAPPAVVWTVFGCLYALLLVPLVVQFGPPLLARLRRSEAADG